MLTDVSSKLSSKRARRRVCSIFLLASLYIYSNLTFVVLSYLPLLVLIDLILLEEIRMNFIIFQALFVFICILSCAVYAQTVAPTTSPTTSPTASPTATPTMVPTATPTAGFPTYAPSNQVSSMFYFTSVILLNGVSASDLTDSDEQAIIVASAMTMGIPSNEVIITNYKTSLDNRRVRILRSDKDDVEKADLLTTTYVAYVGVKTSVLVNNTNQAQSLYDQYDAAFTAKAFNPYFTQAVATYSAPSLEQAYATEVTTAPYTYDNPDSADDGIKLSKGALAGVIIAVIFGLIFGFYCIYFCTEKAGGSDGIRENLLGSPINGDDHEGH